ncbi:MAG TPA: glycosyltransferase, partial [Thermoanaerobaculia bacterium]
DNARAVADAGAAVVLPAAVAGLVPASAVPPAVRVVEFLADMPAAVGAAHLVVSRAGAITTAELLAAGRPAVLVPLRGLAGGHQLDNARAVADAGAAVVLPAADLDADRLAAALAELLEDRGRLARMAERARAAGRPDAARAIAERVEALAAGRVA